jgi:hypothetical protein
MGFIKTLNKNVRGKPMNKTQLYNDHKRIIKAMASKAASYSGLEKDDLECEGNLIFCECAEKYDPEKGNFENYLSRALRQSFSRYVKKENRYYDMLKHSDDAKIEEYSCRENFAIVEDYYNKLSADCKKIYELIFSPEVHIERMANGNRITQRKLEKYLRSEGWKFSRIQSAFTEIKNVLEV